MVAWAVSNDFTPNTKAKSAEVNENFADVETKINLIADENNKIEDNGVIEDSITAGAVSFGKLAAGTVETSSDTLTDTDTAVPTGAAVMDYAATVVAGAGFWKTAGDTVPKFDGSASAKMSSAVTFEELDLSSIIGSNAGLVYLEVYTTSGDVFVARPKGFGGAWATHYQTGQTWGVTVLDFLPGAFYGYLVVPADSAGVIEVGSNSASALWTVKVVGYTI